MLKSFLMLSIAVLYIALFAVTAQAQEDHGKYLAQAGDCTSCHTATGHAPFAGSYPLQTPLGIIYGTNITPDTEYGIGGYSLEDFRRALREGIARDGHHLYPAMPYVHFAKMSDEDTEALYHYFMHEVQPVHERAAQTHLPFPFSQRWSIVFWNAFFYKDERYQPQAGRDAAWNRGAYLVQSLGHCGECHTPLGPAFEERSASENSPVFLSGGILDYWFAPSLRGDTASGLGRWSEGDIAGFLATGHGEWSDAFGGMEQVVENSTQYMTGKDRAAIAHYLKSLEPSGEEASYRPASARTVFERPGAGIYASACASCHGADGAGRAPFVPNLAGNSAVLPGDATSVIRIVLQGGVTVQTQAGPRPSRMPGFAGRLNDREIADVVSFIRLSWGNHAAAATPAQVAALRQALKK